MALRTISPSGGSWSATSSWVEGIVPGSSDYVLGNSASGNIIMDVGAVGFPTTTIQRLDLTDYRGTIDMNWRTLTLNETGGPFTIPAGTSYFGPSVSWINTGPTGSEVWTNKPGGALALSINHNIFHYFATGSQPIPTIRCINNTNIRAYTDIHTDGYIRQDTNTGIVNSINGNWNFYIYKAFLGHASGANGGFSSGLQPVKFIMVGSGTFSTENMTVLSCNLVNCTIEMRGQVVSYGGGSGLSSVNNVFPTLNGVTLITTTSSDCSQLVLDVGNTSTTTGETLTFSCANPIGVLRFRTFVGTFSRTYNINSIDNGLKCNLLSLEGSPSSMIHSAATNNTAETINFNGNMSIKNMSVMPTIRMSNTQSPTNFPTLQTSILRLTPNLKFESGKTFSITNLFYCGDTYTAPLISSSTASQPAFLVIGSSSIVTDTSITDINVSGEKLYLYGSGTISNSTNVVFGPPTGGGGGQFGFASIN